MSPDPGSSEARRRKLFQLADELSLTRDERIELSRAILWRDIMSWKDLTDEQMDRLLDALEGAEKVIWLLTNRA
jgi:hypothetical protein